jgi:hypothetical protein
MTDLKPYYDNVLKAQANVQAVINQIDELMALGTPEGDEQAMALAPQLDEATAKAEKAENFYNKLRKASETSNVTRNFLPVSAEEIPDEEEKKPKGVMNRAEFEKLDARERKEFVLQGGRVQQSIS